MITSKTDWETPISNIFIYGLIDPRDGQLKYIGKTTRGIERLRQHCYSVTTRSNERNYRKINWIKKLDSLNLKFQVIYLEYCTEETLDEAEMFNIAYFKSIGCKLLNHSNGGEETYRHKYTEEEKKHLSIKSKNAWKNPEIRQKYIDSHKEKPGNNKGKKFSDQARKNIKDSIQNRVSIIDSNGKEHESLLAASKEFNCSPTAIRRCIMIPHLTRNGVTFKKKAT